MRAATPLRERIEARTDRAAPGGCHLWCGPMNRNQPITHRESKRKGNVSVRRQVWLYVYGEMPKNRVFTLCGNFRCLNPEHLTSPDEVQRFWRWVNKSGGKEACWPWTGSCTHGNYGAFQRADQTKSRSHRFAYELTHGVVLTEEQVLMHLCDNPPCCNPKHLKIGTHRENIHDMIAKGRQSVGDRHREAMRKARERRTALTGREGT